MNKYFHTGTSLGTINVRADGLEVHCTVSIMRRPDRGPITTHEIDFTFVNVTRDHEGGMDALINGALAKGKSLADAYIAARECEAAQTTPMPPKDFSKRTKLFSAQNHFEVYVQDSFDPAIRQLTLSSGVGTDDELHVVLMGTDLKSFLAAMTDLQATPFSERPNAEEAA